MRRVAAWLVLVYLLCPPTASARQRVSTPRLGEEVRVRSTEGRVHIGTLRFASSDSLVLALDGDARVAIRTSVVTEMRAHRVVPARTRIWRGALVGAAVGFLPGAIATLAKGRQEHCRTLAGQQSCTREFDSIEESAILPGFMFGIVGGGVGLSVRWRRWERVPLGWTLARSP